MNSNNRELTLFEKQKITSSKIYIYNSKNVIKPKKPGKGKTYKVTLRKSTGLSKG